MELLSDEAQPAFLVQLLLPTRDNDQRPISGALFSSVRATLADRFGGVTAYQRSPAAGIWKRPDGTVDGDDLVMVEVEVEAVDRLWWRTFRQLLEREFKQQKVLMRAIRVDTL